MDISSYVLLSHEQALRRRLDVTANNMANTSTVGFKREQPVFHEYVERSGENAVPSARKTSYVLDYGAVHDVQLGAFQPTGNPLDVMIDGPGYLAVETPEGTAYTRAGFVKVLLSGDLATAGGQRLLDANGKPVNVPPDQLGNLSIGADGSVVGSQGPLGRLAVTVFENEAAVSPRGDGLMTAAGGRILAAGETKLVSGGVEGSNVQPIVETTAMVEILRSYQSSQRLTQGMEELRKNAISRLGRFT
ncbi:flagellar hook-basal body complex protein [Sphingomonas sp. 37zxx]|uniref:flagellar hook-basal body complex protein n=1 Tax=Sphingomonas sp. 37zxx TaxID=1550073 RepID=UPI00053C07DC|nr:flagellar hook-basal body complex protein [Sphingomonas sp. 37zxx]